MGKQFHCLYRFPLSSTLHLHVIPVSQHFRRMRIQCSFCFFPLGDGSNLYFYCHCQKQKQASSVCFFRSNRFCRLPVNCVTPANVSHSTKERFIASLVPGATTSLKSTTQVRPDIMGKACVSGLRVTTKSKLECARSKDKKSLATITLQRKSEATMLVRAVSPVR